MTSNGDVFEALERLGRTTEAVYHVWARWWSDCPDRDAFLATIDAARQPLDVEALGLSDEQAAILRDHLESRQQTVSEFLGDVLMEYGIGRATGKEYPPPARLTDKDAETP